MLEEFVELSRGELVVKFKRSKGCPKGASGNSIIYMKMDAGIRDQLVLFE